MPIVAAGVSFSGSETARQDLSSRLNRYGGTAATAATAAAAADASDRVAGMIKKAVYRSSGRRVHGEDDKILAIKTVAPDLPLDVLRNMDIRVDPWSAPPCAPPNALRIRPGNARTSGAHVSRSDVRGLAVRSSSLSRSCSGSTSLVWCNATHQQMALARSHAYHSLANEHTCV